MLVSEILEKYRKEHIAVKVVAWKRAEQCITALNSFFDDTEIGEVDIPLCREYRVHRNDVVDATVRRELGVLQAAVNHCLRWRHIKAGAQLPSVELPPDSQPKPLWLFKEEVGRLLEVAEANDRRVFRFVQLAYHTAARKASIESLRWAQVDLSSCRIDLKTVGAPDTKKRQPIVPISANMAEQLLAMKPKATTEFVLVTADDIRPAFDRVAKLAGLAELSTQGMRPSGRCTPHVLRHSRATHLLQDGKQPWGVAQLLGDTLPTVLRVYGHCCSSYLQDIVS